MCSVYRYNIHENILYLHSSKRHYIVKILRIWPRISHNRMIDQYSFLYNIHVDIALIGYATREMVKDVKVEW